MPEYVLIAFASTFAALRAQKYLTGYLPFQVMPVLREISSSCGIALRIACADLDFANNRLSASGMEPDTWRVYQVKQTGCAYLIEPVKTTEGSLD